MTRVHLEGGKPNGGTYCFHIQCQGMHFPFPSGVACSTLACRRAWRASGERSTAAPATEAMSPRAEHESTLAWRGTAQAASIPVQRVRAPRENRVWEQDMGTPCRAAKVEVSARVASLRLCICTRPWSLFEARERELYYGMV